MKKNTSPSPEAIVVVSVATLVFEARIPDYRPRFAALSEAEEKAFHDELQQQFKSLYEGLFPGEVVTVYFSFEVPTYQQYIRAFCSCNGISLSKLDRKMAQEDYRRQYPNARTYLKLSTPTR